MPLPTTLKLFIDAKAGLAYPTYSSSSPISNPSFFLGDMAKLRIYFIEQTGVGTYPRQEVDGLGSPGIKVAIGAIDESPTAGHFHLTFGGDTTSNQVFNVTAAALAADLNALASIIAAGGVTVTKIGDNYSIKFTSNGARGAITGNGLALIPLSTVGITVLQDGDGSTPEIILVHLQQNVAALAITFNPTDPSTITSTVLSAWDGARATYRASISPDPKAGTFTLAFDADTGTDVSTSAIAVGSTALEVQNALSKDALLDLVTVQQVGAYAYDITVLTEPGAGGLTGDSAGLLSFAGFEGDLDINTANAISYLDGDESITTTLEVEISDGTDTQTILQIPCTLRSSVVDESTVNAVSLDPVLTQATGDGRYLRQANDLSDVTSVATARANLDIYSTAETDAAIAAASGSFLPLAGGTMTGAITFDAVGAQNINKGTFDNSTGGYNGISLICAVGYELNWQGGHLGNWYSGAFQPIVIDSSLDITHADGIKFSDDTIQITAAVTFTGGSVATDITQADATFDSELGAWGFGVQNTSTPAQNAYIEYDEVNVSNSAGGTSITPTGITFPDSSVQTTAASAGLNQADVFAMAIVTDTTFAGTNPAPGTWTINFRPINQYIKNNDTIYVENGDGSISQVADAAASSTADWSYVATYDTFPGDQYFYIKINGIKGTLPINFP